MNLNFDLGEVTDNTFQEIKDKRKVEKVDIEPSYFDYMIGNDTSLRFEHIKTIEDDAERLTQMSEYIKEVMPLGFPDEYYDWYARDVLGMQYTKYEIADMKRKYKIERKRALEKKKQEEKRLKNCMKVETKKTTITFD